MTILNDSIQDIYAILIGRKYQHHLFAECGTLKPEGRELMTTCPACGSDRFSVSLTKPVYKCWRCETHGDWLTYLQTYRGLTFWEALTLLAEEAAVNLPPHTISQTQQISQQRQRIDLMTAAHNYFLTQLWQPAGKAVRDYLHSRGYSDAVLQTMGIGAFVSRNGLLAHLHTSGFSEADVRQAGLLLRLGQGQALGESHCVAVVYRDRAGRPNGFQFRCLLGTDAIAAQGWQKYLNSKGLRKGDSLAESTHAMAHLRGAREVVLTEAPLAASYLNARQLSRPVVATAGKSLSTAQLNSLHQMGVKLLYCAYDMDKAGQTATCKLIKQLQGEEIRLLVVSWSAETGKALDDLALTTDLQTAENALSAAFSVGMWLGLHLLGNVDSEGVHAAVEQERLFYEAAKQYEWLQDSLDRRDMVQTLAQQLALPATDIAARIGHGLAQKQAEQSRQLLENMARKALRVVQEDGVSAAENSLREGLDLLRQMRGAKPPTPYTFDTLLSDINQLSEGLSLGFQVFDQLVTIPRGGLTVIAALSGHGKTTMMLNLLAHTIAHCPDEPCYFFTYEEPARAIAIKLIMIWAGEVLHPHQNFDAYTQYLRFQRGTNARIEQAIVQFQQATQTGKLVISDAMLHAEDLATTLGVIGQSANSSAIFIDYIQTIPTRQTHNGARYLALQHTARLLREVAVIHNLTIITGSQLNRGSGVDKFVKLEHLRESGDIGHEAALVLGLYTGEVNSSNLIRIDVTKQRGGTAGISRNLVFERAILKIKDSQKLSVQQTCLTQSLPHRDTLY